MFETPYLAGSMSCVVLQGFAQQQTGTIGIIAYMD